MSLSVHVPMIHLNGTAAEDLEEQLRNAIEGCDALLIALNACTPHGRDYYPYGAERIHEALKDHSKRYAAVSQIRCQLELIVLGIQEQEGARKC